MGDQRRVVHLKTDGTNTRAVEVTGIDESVRGFVTFLLPGGASITVKRDEWADADHPWRKTVGIVPTVREHWLRYRRR